MPKLKLAYVTHGLSSNGIESFLVNIAHYIDMEKYDVSFVIAVDKGVKSLHEEAVKALGAKVINICDLDSTKKKLEYIKKLEQIFLKEGFDIVHANMDLLNGIVLRAAKRAKIKKRICHSHTSSSQYVNSGKIIKALQKAYQRVMKRLIIKNSTDLLGCSDKANEYMYGKNANKARVVNNGIPLLKFMNPEQKSFEQLKMKDGVLNLVTVGRLSTPKNPMFIVDVIKELTLLRQDFVFNWVGGGEKENQIKAAIKEKRLERFINMMGVRTDIPSILQKCKMFLMPSLFEGLPVSLIEAQAAGLECFISNTITSMADFGACHFVSLDIGPQKWAEIIDKALRTNKPLKADEKKLMSFDISQTIKTLDEIYNS